MMRGGHGPIRQLQDLNWGTFDHATQSRSCNYNVHVRQHHDNLCHPSICACVINTWVTYHYMYIHTYIHTYIDIYIGMANWLCVTLVFRDRSGLPRILYKCIYFMGYAVVAWLSGCGQYRYGNALNLITAVI